MAPPKPPEEEGSDDSSTSSPPAKRKPSVNNTPTPGKRKPTPTSTPKRATLNGPRTPARKASGKRNGTPNSAPARKVSKAAEPTLLTDFLLGRPSPQRVRNGGPTRRKSLDLVKAEMRAGNMARVQAPGKVHDRVKQWQKANAAAVIQDTTTDTKEAEVEVDTSSDGETVGEEHNDKQNHTGRKPGRRKSKTPEEEPPGPPKNRPKQAAVNPPRNKGPAPKKRVISDSHWMNKKLQTEKRNTIPKNFLQATALNPPVEKKIEDWVKRTESGIHEPVIEKSIPKIRKPRNPAAEESDEDGNDKKPSQQDVLDDGIRIKPSREIPHDDGIRIIPLRKNTTRGSTKIKPPKDTPDDGIRVTPARSVPDDDNAQSKPRSANYPDDGIRIRPSRDNSPHEDIEVKPAKRDGSRRSQRSRREPDVESTTPSRRSGKHLEPHSETPNRRASSHGSRRHEEDEDKTSCTSPSPPEGSRHGKKRVATPPESLDEIPFGNSAFSVLDLPLGAEAGNLKRPPPKRNSSFMVPKVFKKVYNEIVHDNAEPPRGGPNQPRSIESWLDGTGDPFVDRPAPPASVLEVPESSSEIKKSHDSEDQTVQELTVERDGGRKPSQKIKPRYSWQNDELEPSPIPTPKHRDTLPSVEKSPPVSPAGLKRSPATRNTSSSKPGKKMPLKEAIFGAFQGESVMKKPAPSPYDYIGMREHEIKRVSSIARSKEPETEPEVESKPTLEPELEPEPKQDRTPTKASLHTSERTVSEPVKQDDKPLPIFPKRLAPTTGVHRLSTIASVETFSTSSSVSQTASDISETTVTQNTNLTAPTGSSLSRKSKRSTSKNNGLKRRLTKHSDLMSMLSLPDTTEPGRMASIRSARSVRTTRTKLETATVEDLMRELAEDETKYMRELNTLVEGVIPVLLNSVLSRSDAAVAAGLFDPLADAGSATFTRPIVDMGVALEKLKRLHKHINLTSPDSFLYWADSAHKAYEDYLRAWRSGFEDVVVNLAPASPSGEWEPTIDEMERNEAGDLVTDSGERVDVAYLLKRPCVRVKKLAKATKGIAKNIEHSELARNIEEHYQNLEAYLRKRMGQEEGRREDQKANNTDSSRARNPATLDPEDDVKINRSYQVSAKDSFSFDMQHSSGQKMVCEVELILRESPGNKSVGDLLICERSGSSFFLLFPPQDRSLLSARLGESKSQVVVLMRGSSDEWQEIFVVDADDRETAADWVGWLGQSPLPPPITSKKMEIDPALASVISLPGLDTKSVVGALKAIDKDDVPIGERRQEPEVTTPKTSTKKQPARYHQRPRATQQTPTNQYSTCVIYVHQNLDPEQIQSMIDPEDVGVLDIQQVEHELHKSGKAALPPAKRYSSSRAYDPKFGGTQTKQYTGLVEMSGAIQEIIVPTTTESAEGTPSDEPTSPGPNSEGSSSPVPKTEEPTTPTRDDGAPPPPPHRSPVSSELSKITPQLDPATPRVKRRTSSPLKHEWQPSDASGTSSGSETDSEESTEGSYTDESSSEDEEEDDDDELESNSIHTNLPAGVSIQGKKVSPDGSVYTTATSSLAPSNSASQGPYNATPVRHDKNVKKFVAMVSYWHRNQWVDLYSDPCSIIVTPGHIEVFRMNSSHSSTLTKNSHLKSPGSDSGSDSELPMVEQVLVPWVSLRQSNALDVEIGSPPTARSQLTKLKEKSKIFQFRYRTLNTNDGYALYAACHLSRMNNPKVLEMQRQNAFNSFGSNAYDNAVAANRRRSIFGISLGRKKSYRASSRATSDYESNPSGRSSNSAMSALRRMTGGGTAFNIARSTINLNAPHNGPQSMYSSDSGITPPRTPPSPSLAGESSMYSNGLTVRDIGFENIPIQLYNLVNSTTWNDCGNAFFTCVAPPRGMKQQSALDHGPQKRIIVSNKPINGSSVDEKGKKIIVFLDAILGRDCFKKQGRVGVICSVWEDVVGDDGRVGSVKAYGGVGARTKIWAFQLGRAGDCEWVYQLCTSGQGR